MAALWHTGWSCMFAYANVRKDRAFCPHGMLFRWKGTGMSMAGHRVNKSLKGSSRRRCSLLIQASECDSDSFLLTRELYLYWVIYTHSNLLLWETDHAEHTKVIATACRNIHESNTQFCRGDHRKIKVISIGTNSKCYHALSFLNTVEVFYLYNFIKTHIGKVTLYM